MTTCIVDGCERTMIAARGMCRMHYLRAWRSGTVAEIPSSRPARHECPTGEGHEHTVDGCWTLHGCRCGTCTHDRKMERQRRRSRLRAYGQENRIREYRVDAAPARDTLLRLLGAGHGLERIAAAACVHPSALTNLRYGRRGARAGEAQRTVSKRIAQALAQVNPDLITSGIVDATGTTRRLQALVAMGHTQSELAAALGREVGNLSPIVIGHRHTVTEGTRDAVRVLFDALWDQHPEGWIHDRARRLAARRGWRSPLAWDDIDTDPTPAATEMTQSKGEQVIEDLEWLLDGGESVDQIAVTLGRSFEAIAKLAQRHGRDDLARPFNAAAKRKDAA